MQEPGPLLTAAIFGLGASLLGAVIYCAVMKFLSLELGLVAILTGWMVGKSMRVGAHGTGGPALQIGATALVYLSVAMAYLPFVLSRAGASVGDLLDLGVLGFAVTVPVRAILASMPSGLISAAIIGFGTHQVWQLTAVPQWHFDGPFRVGGGATP